MTDDELLSAFESCTLPAADFRHRDHVRVARLYLLRHGLLAALDRFPRALAAFAAHHGAAGRYHETITWAYLFLVHERLQRAPAGHTWADFERANPDLLSRDPDILTRYYRPETLQSELARRSFVLPDRAPSSGAT